MYKEGAKQTDDESGTARADLSRSCDAFPTHSAHGGTVDDPRGSLVPWPKGVPLFVTAIRSPLHLWGATYLSLSDLLSVRSTFTVLVFLPGTSIEDAQAAMQYLSRRSFDVLLCIAAMPLILGAMLLSGIFESAVLALCLSVTITASTAAILIGAHGSRPVHRLLRQSVRFRLAAHGTRSKDVSAEVLVREIEHLRQTSIVSARDPVSDEELWGRAWRAVRGSANR